ncbi:Type III pantothenate kinase [Pirellulimonas nuda]|uniref:Type III pantothenate kinase n=1 Tax=Pirellulimonas nuda TaxID=2528009 RepID=A0A518DIU6_9BACT|nr:type III pantothenate kinase [Pirellulimonas nuda]QDU91403.1 Type III pantothenate kinase [Pirellulimonas nuda]
MIAVDVGNSRVKLGRFEGAAEGPLPEPGCVAWWRAGEGAAAFEQVFGPEGPLRVALAAVNTAAAAAFIEQARAWADGRGRAISLQQIENRDVPIENRTDAPEKVGIDRLLAAAAANQQRRPGVGAIVVDLGTAITVDLVSPDGAFEGGAILPGIALAARALAAGTDRLPDTPFDELSGAPDAVGRNTQDAIGAGLFWGAVGAIREVIARQRDRLVAPPQVLLTGGAAPSVARLIGGPDYAVRYVPHLVLAGIAITVGGPGR